MGTVALILILAVPPPDNRGKAADAASDVAVLRDRSIVLGQVVEPSPRGRMHMVVRREWARANVPGWLRRWDALDAAALRLAVTERRNRLTAWRAERAARAEPNDPIVAWIGRELARLAAPGAPPPSQLMLVSLDRNDVRTVRRSSASAARMLRQGWLSGFAQVETMPLQALKDALEDRGFRARGESPVPIDRLLRIPNESSRQWITRRAATEVLVDRDLRFIRAGGAVLPEPTPGEPLGLATAASALSGLKQLLGDTPSDPLAETLLAVAARGRVGAVVTRLDLSEDLSSVRVESTLWVREEREHWSPAGSRHALIRLDALAPGAGRDIAEDPQVKAIFDLVESAGLGQIPVEIKQRSLNAGAATQRALAQVRSAFNEDLQRLAFPVGEVPASEAKSVPKP